MSDMQQQPGSSADDTTRRFDWTQIRRRMEDALQTMNPTLVTPARKSAILRARARALAQVPEREQRPGQYIDILEFVIAYERYGLDSAFVREVHPLKDITSLPGAPPFVAGIVNVRGQIVSVIDLKQLFDLPRKGLTDLNRVIILNDGAMEFGLLVDAVIAVQRLPLDDIQPGMPTLTGVRADLLQGVTAQRTIILNAAKMLADPKLVCTQNS
jgi:purine-binding chemotaxis protein CheW